MDFLKTMRWSFTILQFGFLLFFQFLTSPFGHQKTATKSIVTVFVCLFDFLLFL